MKLQPLHDRIVVQAAPQEERTAGGIILPDTAKEKPLRGTVVAVGPGKMLDSGKLAPVDVKSGDTVLYGKYSGTEVTVGGEEYIILRADDILAVFTGKANKPSAPAKAVTAAKPAKKEAKQAKAQKVEKKLVKKAKTGARG